MTEEQKQHLSAKYESVTDFLLAEGFVINEDKRYFSFTDANRKVICVPFSVLTSLSGCSVRKFLDWWEKEQPRPGLRGIA